MGPSDGSKLAEILIAARADRGISQAQAARELNVARSAYRLWELGVARPAPSRWSGLAGWLGVPLTTLLRNDELIPEQGRSPDEDSLETVLRLIGVAAGRGVVTAAEAGIVAQVLERVRAASAKP